MHLGIDASNLQDGGGVTYLAGFLGAADPKTHPFERITVWSGSRALEKIEEREWLRKAHDPLLDRALQFRVYWQRFRLASLAKAAGCDVLFVPGGSDVSGFRPMIAVSRNLLPFDWREMRRYGLTWRILKNALLRVTQTRTFRRADGLILLTQYTRDVVMKAIGQSRGKVAVISHGIDRRFARPPRTQREIGEFAIERPFRLLYVSGVDAYKHQWHVAEAVARLRTAGLPVTLDLVGPAYYAPALARLNRTLRRLDPDGRFIRYRGAVPHSELHATYAAADMKVFASSCESLPHTLLEGMASGLPIACSNRGPMPEVLGEGGLYFDPERPDEIAETIRTLMVSAQLRSTVAQAAFERAQRFSWARCADATFEFLAQVRRA